MYDKKEVKEESLKYFKGDELPADKWIQKYCLKDNEGNLLEKSPDDMHHRLASEFSRIERNYPNPMSESEIYELLKEFKYIIPGGSQMSGIGNNLTRTSLSNCFVIDSPKDSYGGIFLTDQEQVQIMKRRGGVGHDISNLRPLGAIANNSVLSGLAGSTLYMERYSNSTREVAQDGRRGALMLSMDIKHPDIERFIDAKLEQGKVTGANVSVRVSDEFMDSVKNNTPFYQRFPINSDIVGFNDEFVNENELNTFDPLVYNINPDNKLTPPKLFKKINSKSLWNKIVKNAWKSAEPGLLFWDTILRESPAGCYGEEWKEKSTNPCGEIPLCPYDSCRLTAMNLYSYVVNPFTTDALFDFDLFKDHVGKAQRLMDDLIDLEIEKIDLIINKIKSDPEDEYIKEVELKLWNKIKYKAILGRRTGLGITAEGDMLAALGLRYGSKEATDFAVEVHKTMAIESYKASIEMAKERGCFPIWDWEKENKNPFLCRVLDEIEFRDYEDYISYGRRNIANLTIAPTGTTSLMTQTTSGIEPVFLPFYKRRTKVEDRTKATFIDEVGDGWVEYFVVHPKFIEWFSVNHFRIGAKEYLERCSEELLNKYFELSPYYKSTANDIDWESSVEMQGMIQKWIDHSISKTVNLPASATVDIVDKVYRKAYESGCKGVTVYRDGCRSGVLVSNKKEEKKETFEYRSAFKRPQVLECDIYHKTALKQDWLIIVGKINGLPYELFALNDIENHVFPTKITKGTITKVKSKTYKLSSYVNDKLYVIENIIDLMSEDERVSTRKYSSMLRHGMHPKFISEQIDEFATIVSFDKVVQRVLKNYIKEEKTQEECPECGSKNYHAESGCYNCPDCGYAKCG